MISRAILLARCITAVSFGDYRFYKNYGDSFYDYGAGTYHGYNGSTPESDANDGIHTDRGLYLDGVSSYATIHNDYWSTPPVILEPFDLFIFVLVLSDGPLLYRHSASHETILLFELEADGNIKMTMNLLVNGGPTYTSLVHNTGASTFNFGEWALLQFYGANEPVTGSFGHGMNINFSSVNMGLDTGYFYVEGSTAYTRLGNNVAESFQGIFYSFFVNTYFDIDPVTLFSQSCTPSDSACSVCPIENSACLYHGIDPFRNSDGVSCSGCTNGCATDMSCLDCPIESLPFCETGTPTIPSICDSSCTACMGPTPNDCATCPSPELHVVSPPGPCVCVNGNTDTANCHNCVAGCLSCTVSYFSCEQCEHSGAISKTDNSGECECPSNSTLVGLNCECNQYYYDSDPSNSLQCTECNIDCETCSDSSMCLSCKDPNASINSTQGCDCPIGSQMNNGACECISGYFNNNGNCEECHEECEECEDFSVCLTCKSTFAIPDLEEGCRCPDSSYLQEGECVCEAGYFMSSSGSCESCREECEECEDFSVCLTCKNSFLIPDLEEGCRCPDSSYLQEGECVCETGYFKGSSGFCESCGEGCEVCDEDECTECLENKGWIKEEGNCVCREGSELEEDECVCKEGFERSTSSNKCIKSVSFEEELLKVFNATFKIIAFVVGIVAAALTVYLENPLTLWTIVNSVQMFSYIPLHNVKLTEKMDMITANFEITEYIPNIILIIWGHSDIELMVEKEKWKEFTDTASFYENIGECISTLAISVGVFVLHVISLLIFPCWRDRIYKKLRLFKFGVFLRLILELYLVLAFASVLSFHNLSNNSQMNTEDIVGSVVFLLCVLTPILTSLLIWKLKKSILEKNENVMKSFGTLFSEFKITDSFGSFIYYPCFLFRRLVFMVSLFYFYEFPKLQFLTNISGNISMICVLVILIEFKSKKRMVLEILSEIGLCLIFIILSFLNFDMNDITRDYLEYSIICLGFAIITCNFLYIIATAAVKFRKKCTGKNKKDPGKVIPISMSKASRDYEQVFESRLEVVENIREESNVNRKYQAYVIQNPIDLY